MPEMRIASDRSAEMVQSILAELPTLEAPPRICGPVSFVHGSRSPMPLAASTDEAERKEPVERMTVLSYVERRCGSW